MFGHFEEIAASKQQICNQVQQLLNSINKCEDKIEEQFQDLYNLKETRKEHHLSEWERSLADEENLIEAIGQNVKRIKKYNELVAKTLEDANRIELHIKSRFYAKVDIFLHCFVALITGMFMVTGSLSLYLLNLVAVLKINFSILEIIGLQNWQRHKLLGSIAMNVLEFFLFGWLYYDDFGFWTEFWAEFWAEVWAEVWPGFWAGLFGTGPILLCVLVFIHRVILYSDMKKPRPVIPNFNTPFPA